MFRWNYNKNQNKFKWIINPLASPSAGAPALNYGDVNTETTSPVEVKGLIYKKYKLNKKWKINLDYFFILLINKIQTSNLRNLVSPKITEGVINYKNGEKYEGHIKNGLRDGQGIYYYNNGDKYEGSWINDKIEGKGVYYWKDGDRTLGNFANDQNAGLHAMLLANGEVVEKNYNK